MRLSLLLLVPIRLFIGASMPLGNAVAEPINCVEFVEAATNFGLHGNAWQWWDDAAPLYARGHQPTPGGVIVFGKSRSLRNGHVGVVTAQIDPRTILVAHANWSPLRGHRGDIEDAAPVIDVSPANDWTQVRVWYAPVSDIGQTVYPVRGFVYPWHRVG